MWTTSVFQRSTNLDSWSPEQLKMMFFGGNNRAHTFFKQHGWGEGGGKVEAKYTSRAADLYKQILAKEVAKNSVEDSSLPSSPVASQSAQASNGFSDANSSEIPKEIVIEKKETADLPASPTARSVSTSTVKRPLGLGAKKAGKSGGLGARKLTKKVCLLCIVGGMIRNSQYLKTFLWKEMILCLCNIWLLADPVMTIFLQPNEDLYEQKPEEPPAPVATPSSKPLPVGSSYPSRFEYVENNNTTGTEKMSEGPQMISHVAPPKSSSFFADFGMDSGFQRKGSLNSSKVQVSCLKAG